MAEGPRRFVLGAPQRIYICYIPFLFCTALLHSREKEQDVRSLVLEFLSQEIMTLASTSYMAYYCCMSRSWKVIYYEDRNQTSEVFQFIQSQKCSSKAKILSWLDLLEEKGPVLPRPYSDLLRDGIHELRIKLSARQVRILYFFCYKDFIVLTNCFFKNVKRVPEKEISKAIACRSDLLSRYTEKDLMEAYDENVKTSDK